MKILVFSVLPSPYQRDLFRALAATPDITLRVFYTESAAPDSPWMQTPLEAWEHILPGRTILAIGNLRIKTNRGLPLPEPEEKVILNLDITSLTTQWLMRKLPKKSWVFWGEKMRQQTVFWRKKISGFLTNPIHNAAAVAGVGEDAVSDYQRRFPKLPVYSIPYHCDLKSFLSIPEKELQEDIVFLFCGQMIARKGFDLLLQAFDRLVQEKALVRLLLIGRETVESACIRALPEKIKNRITNAGFQQPENLFAFFKQADVFVLPSRYEGWGVVVNQALGAGLPILCSDAVGARELVDDANGFIFKSGDVDALYEALRCVVKNREKLFAMGQASRKKAEKWSPESGAKKWVQIFEKMI